MRLQVQVILYFIVLHLLQFFGLNDLIYALKPDLKWLLGTMTGDALVTLHEASDGSPFKLKPASCSGTHMPSLC